MVCKISVSHDSRAFLSIMDMPQIVRKCILSIIVLLGPFTMGLVQGASLLVVYMIIDLTVVNVGLMA
jgi:hypothetical protein